MVLATSLFSIQHSAFFLFPFVSFAAVCSNPSCGALPNAATISLLPRRAPMSAVALAKADVQIQGRIVFGGTPNTARETHALPGIVVARSQAQLGPITPSLRHSRFSSQGGLTKIRNYG